jgi:GntR family transcriptional regulator of vanillate catabolism
VRAALQTLAGEGLLTYLPNRGFLVRGFALADIIDAYEMRALAEGLAARLAAERGLSATAQLTLSEVLTQGDALLRSEASATAGRAVYARVNEDFHTTIHSAAGTALVLDVIRLCQRVPQSSTHNVVAFEFDDVRNRHEAHHRIFEAIVMREPRQAETLMRQHVLSVKTSLIRSYTAARRPASADTE